MSNNVNVLTDASIEQMRFNLFAEAKREVEEEWALDEGFKEAVKNFLADLRQSPIKKYILSDEEGASASNFLRETAGCARQSRNYQSVISAIWKRNPLIETLLDARWAAMIHVYEKKQKAVE